MSGEKRTYVSIDTQELRRLREQESRLRSIRSDLPGCLDEIRNQAQGAIDRIKQDYTSRIQVEKIAREEKIKDLQSQINSIVTDSHRKHDIANSFIKKDLEKLLKETNRLQHQRFAPGELEFIKRQINDANQNLNNRMPEAAISTGQKAYSDLIELKIRVMEKEKEFSIL